MTSKLTERRLLGFFVTPECVAEFARSGTRSVSIDSPIPEGARFFNAWYAQEKRCFVCVFEHESFGLIAEGCEIPMSEFPIKVTSV